MGRARALGRPGWGRAGRHQDRVPDDDDDRKDEKQDSVAFHGLAIRSGDWTDDGSAGGDRRRAVTEPGRSPPRERGDNAAAAASQATRPSPPRDARSLPSRTPNRWAGNGTPAEERARRPRGMAGSGAGPRARPG